MAEEEVKDKLVESLEYFAANDVETLKGNILKLVKDYKRKSKRLDKIIKQSDKQQRELMHLNEELEEYKNHLEKKVQEETRKRMEQQELLVRQSRLAAMGEMMSAITHQWAQPLNVIGMSADMIEFTLDAADPENHDILEHAQSIRNSKNFMNQTMQDFKNYFKPNKRKKAFPIKTEIETVAAMLSSQLRHACITAHFEDVNEKLEGYGIASEFKQVVLNLISNAKDAIKSQTNGKGPGDIWFRASEEESYILLEAEDSGGGIPEDVIDHIFDDYFTTKGEGGTGIGLAMSKMIIEEGMGGTISVTNTDKGACFKITIEKIPA